MSGKYSESDSDVGDSGAEPGPDLLSAAPSFKKQPTETVQHVLIRAN